MYKAASTSKIWKLAGRSLTLAISRHSGDYIPSMDLNPLEIIYNKPLPSILFHIKDDTMRQELILYLQEVKRDIIFRHAQPRVLYNGKKKRRTATSNLSSSALSDQQDTCPA
jgi:hypothetical protein